MLRLALANPKRCIRVVNDQYGSLTWSWRLALQIERLLVSDLTGIFHATSEGYSTWYEAARCFLDCMGLPYSMSQGAQGRARPRREGPQAGESPGVRLSR